MVPLWVYDHDEVTPTVLQVYVALAALAWGNAGRQPMSRIMERCGLKKSATYAAVGVLERIGAVHREGRDEWYLPTDAGSTTMETGHEPSTMTDESSATTETDSATTESHLLSLETSPDQDTSSRADAIAAGFDTFWQAYPRKTAKGAARTAWPAAVKAAGGVQVIIEGARRYADDPNRDEAYTAHASTWLRAERWSDDPLPPRAKPNGKAPTHRPIMDDRSVASGRIDL